MIPFVDLKRSTIPSKMEVEERDRNAVARRIKEAHFPKMKTLEDFAFSDAPTYTSSAGTEPG